MSSEEARKRALVVEDEPLLLLTIRRMLESMGCDTVVAATCREAEDRWGAASFNVVITDLRLTDRLSTEMVGAMRARGFVEPVILVTAEPDLLTDALKLKLGIRAVLRKPLDADALRRVLEGVMASGGAACASACAGRIGRFAVIACPPQLSVDTLDACLAGIGRSQWIALDLRLCTGGTDEAVQRMTGIADSFTRGGGRFCVIAPAQGGQQEPWWGGIRGRMDVVDREDELLALGRRAIASCERAEILGSPVGRDN